MGRQDRDYSWIKSRTLIKSYYCTDDDNACIFFSFSSRACMCVYILLLLDMCPNM